MDEEAQEGTGLRRQTLFAQDSVAQPTLVEWFNAWCERLRDGVAAHMAQDDVELQRLQVDSSDEVFFLVNRWAVRLRGQIWGETYRTIEIRYPDGWWQAVRQRFLPAWWLRHHVQQALPERDED